jgi:hypothetical protein
MSKGLFARSKFSIKNLVKVFFDKVLYRVNLHQKLCQITLMDFEGIETHLIFLKTLTDFDGN